MRVKTSRENETIFPGSQEKKTGENFADTELSDQTDLTYDLRSINSKPAGMTMRRVAKKPENIYYDGDFFQIFVNRYYQSLLLLRCCRDCRSWPRLLIILILSAI